jgi:hypothetical protein
MISEGYDLSRLSIAFGYDGRAVQMRGNPLCQPNEASFPALSGS